MKKGLKWYLAKLESEIDIKRMYRRIEKEERSRHEEADHETLRFYVNVLDRAIAEAKKADTYNDALWWLGRAKRYSIRYFKVKKQLEEAES